MLASSVDETVHHVGRMTETESRLSVSPMVCNQSMSASKEGSQTWRLVERKGCSDWLLIAYSDSEEAS